MFDHAQSPRLGQPTAVENPGVQLCTLETLPEVAYRGQIVYMLDEDKFQVFDGVAWQSPTAEATGGVQTFVSDTEPVADAVGDLWMSTVSYQLYVWTGTVWAAVVDPQAEQAANDASQALADAASALDLAATAKDTADAKVTVFYDSVEPVTAQIGDLWINTINNRLYRYSGASGDPWDEIQDEDIVAALNAAGTAQSTADLKIETYFTNWADRPTGLGPAGIGDLLFVLDDKQHPYRWSGSTWVSIRDDTITDAQNTANSKIQTYVAAAAPWPNGDSAHLGKNVGDLWYDTANGNQIKRWDGDSWELLVLGDDALNIVTSDGRPPAQVTGVSTIGGIGLIFVKWTQVSTNADGAGQLTPVTYEVHVSELDGFAPSPATLLATTASTMIAAKTLANGTPFIYELGEVQKLYYFRVVAKDEDAAGAASAQVVGSMVKATSGDLAANSVTATQIVGETITGDKIHGNTITSDKIKTGEVWVGTVPIGALTSGGAGGQVAMGSTALTATGTSGGFVKLSNAGVELFDSTAIRVVNLPTDISDINPATFRGNIDAQGLTSSKTASFSGITRLEQGSTTYIGLSTQPPSIQPTALVDWPSTQFTGYNWAGFQCAGLQWDSVASQWIVSIYGIDESNGNKLTTKVLRYNAAGVYQSNSYNLTYLATQQGGGAVYLNGRYYVAFTDFNAGGSEGYHRIWCSNSADIAHNKRILGRDNVNPPRLFTDGTDLFHVDQDPVLTNRPFISKVAAGDVPLAAGADIMVNGQFETDTSGWSPQGASMVLSAVTPSFGAAAGTKSMQIQADGMNNSAGANRYGIPAVPGYYYTVTAKVRCATTNTQPVVAVMTVHDCKADNSTANTSDLFGTTGNVPVDSSAWVTLTVTGFTHKDATQLYIATNFLQANSVALTTAQKFYVDDIQVHATAGFNQKAAITGSVTSGVTWSSGAQISGAAISTDGGGANRYWIGPPHGLGAGQITSYLVSDGTWQTDDTFPCVDGGSMGFTHNGTNFYSMNNSGVLSQHTGLKWPATDTATWWAGNTYQDTVVPSAETALGPLRSFTMKKRARLVLTAPDLTGLGTAVEPNTSGHYVVRGTAQPAWNQIYYQGNTMPVAPSTKSIYTITTLPSTTTTNSITGLTTAPNPASNPKAFPTGTAAKLVSSEIGSNQLIQLNGNGSGRVGPLSWDTAGKILTAPDGNPIATVLLFAGAWNQVPGNYLMCDGTAYSVPIANGGTTDAYAALYAIIGFTYGTGAAGTFKVPDLRQRFALGSDKNSAAAGVRNPGASDGLNSGSGAGTRDTLMTHSHTTPGHEHWNPGVDHQHGHSQHTHDKGTLIPTTVGDRATGTGNRLGTPMTGRTGAVDQFTETQPADRALGVWTNSNQLASTNAGGAYPYLTLTYIIKYRDL